MEEAMPEQDLTVDIRAERAEDRAGVTVVLQSAFGQDSEANLVGRLRANTGFIPGLSLVAELDGVIVGYILLFPVTIESGEKNYQSLALAPLAVVPEHQNRNIGARLVAAATRRAVDMDHESVIVLGFPEYYIRFGFQPASRWSIKAPFDAPEESFMAKELIEGGLEGVSGLVRYPEEFFDL